jgi:protein phosphatase
VGDSEAVFVELGSGRWVRLTQDHKIASSPAERARLQAKSGQAAQSRLYGLNLARMLGDRFLKEQDLGFLAEPSVSEGLVVPPGGRGLVVAATDGLWDVVGFEKVAAVVRRQAGEAGQGQGQGQGLSPARVADTLMSLALLHRSKDDISVAVMLLAPPAAATRDEGTAQGAAEGGGGEAVELPHA